MTAVLPAHWPTTPEIEPPAPPERRPRALPPVGSTVSLTSPGLATSVPTPCRSASPIARPPRRGSFPPARTRRWGCDTCRAAVAPRGRALRPTHPASRGSPPPAPGRPRRHLRAAIAAPASPALSGPSGSPRRRASCRPSPAEQSRLLVGRGRGRWPGRRPRRRGGRGGSARRRPRPLGRGAESRLRGPLPRTVRQSDPGVDRPTTRRPPRHGRDCDGIAPSRSLHRRSPRRPLGRTRRPLPVTYPIEDGLIHFFLPPVGRSLVPSIRRTPRAACSARHGERVAEHRPAAFGLPLIRLVLDDVPMLNEDPILNPQDVRSDPVRWRPEPRKAAVDDDKVAVSQDEAGFVLQRRWEAPDEVEQPLAARCDVRAVLNVAGRPEPLGGGVVASVEQRIEGFKHQCFVLLLQRLIHCSGSPSTIARPPNAKAKLPGRLQGR